MTQPGRAAIEIVGDASKLGPQLERDAQRAIDNTDLDLTSISKQIGDGFRKGADDGADALGELGDEAERTFRRIRTESEDFARALSLDAEEIADRIGVSVQTARNWIDGLQVPIERNRRALIQLGSTVDDVGDSFTRTGRRASETVEEVGLLTRIGRGIASSFSRVGDVLGAAAAGVAGLGASLASSLNPAAIALFVAQFLAFASVIPLVIGLAAALADLAGFLTALPAAVGVAASSIIVLTVAFQGFGDALGAIIDGDPEKIAEALEKLAPAARQVAREFERVLPLFRQTGDLIQQEFFEPLVGQVTIFGERVLPRLRDELGTLAQAMGRALGNLGDLATDAQNVGVLERLLASTTRITDQLGAAVADLGQSLLNALDAALPSLERLTGGLAEGINSFAAFIDSSIADGSFQAFFEDAVATGGELLDLVGALGELLGVLFTGTDEGGRDFITTLTDLTQRLTEFFKSAEGQEALQDFEEIMGAVGVILGFVINATREFIDIFTELDDAVESVIFFFQDLWDSIVAAWNGITSATGSAVDSVGQFFTDLWTDITEIWDGIVESVTGAVDAIVAWFQALPGRVLAFIQAIPGAVVDVFNMLIDGAISVLAAGIATLIVIFTDGPRQVAGAFQALWDRLVSIWDGIVLTVTGAVDAIIAFFAALPGQLAEIGQGILDWASATWNTVVQTVTDAVNTVVTFVSGLPGRIAAFFQQLYDSAVARLTSLVEFVRGIPGRILTALGNVGRMLYDSGAKIVQGLIDGISSKIQQLREKIASAVQTIRDHLPFSPAKTGPLSGAGSPQIAGAVIAEMIAAGLDAGTPLIAQAAGRAAGATTSPFGAIGQAGVTPLISPTGTAAGGTSVLSPVESTSEAQPVFIVRIGDEEIEAFIDKRVDERMRVEVRRLMAGARGA